MSLNVHVHLIDALEVEFEIEAGGGGRYFTVDVSHRDNLGVIESNVVFFVRPDQLAELFYAFRDADSKYLDPCPLCEGSGKVPGDEPTIKIACTACRGSGATLKPVQVAP